MAYSQAHVTAASGFSARIGTDLIDGWPINPLKLVLNENFFIPMHAGDMLRLFYKAQSANYTSGFTAASGFTQVQGPLVTRWSRGKMGIPGLEAY